MILFFLLVSTAPTAQALFTEGVQAQLEGRGEDAQSAWERVVRSGVRNSDVEFNLGTSYAEANELGLAVLHLKRAMLLKPAPDSSGNLHIVRERVLEANPGHTRELSLLGDVADQLVRVPFIEIFGLALALAALLVALHYGVFRGRFRALGLGVALASIVTAGAAMGAAVEVVYHEWRPPAVVLKRTKALSGPDERFKTVMELGAGEEVRLTSKAGAVGFTAIELPSGETAFVAEANVAKVKDWQ